MPKLDSKQLRLLKKKAKEIGKKYRLDFIILYGSKIKDTPPGPETDIDLGIYRRRQGIGVKEYLAIRQEFQALFPQEDIDLKRLHHLNPLFRFQAVYRGKLLYGDPLQFEEFKAYAYRSFIDALPLLKLEKKLVKKFQKELLND